MTRELARRGRREPVDPHRPYAYFVEPERTARGVVEDVATLFLTNRECPFDCLMCDLWKHTLGTPTPAGAIPAQIDFALARLPPARHIKLYNSGNFFDKKAIPPEDHPAIAARVAGFDTVIVENHPNLCTPDVLRFRDRIPGQLEVAIGLETAHPETLARLNKAMTLQDVRRAVDFLLTNGIQVRAFVLLRPPYTTEDEGVERAIATLAFAFSLGIGCCAVIPTRAGTDAMHHLAAGGDFAPPTLTSLERVMTAGLAMKRGRVFGDLWDLERIYDCPACGPARKDRLHRINLEQHLHPPIPCPVNITH
ncbi:MAG: radical SAM protein [Rhodothermales bacterium]|nr:radical SAM protein [Rhodothermales bacterium]